jgi:glycosyltransferase involved in cell wall biosynthesis
VVTLEGGGPLAADLRAAGIPLHEAPRRWRWDLSPALAISRLLRDERMDVLHTFLFLPNFYGRCARLLHRPPAVVSSLRSTGIEGVPRYVAEVLMAPLCDLVIANSQAGKSDLVAKGVAARRVVVVRNGSDLSRFAAIPPRDAADGVRRVGMVAQMEPRKDHAGLVDAFAVVARRFPTARLVLAGDGALRGTVEARVRSAGLTGLVEMPGTVDRPEEIYGRLEIYVQASASQEGTSNSIVEAMASGLPVIATDIGGNAETVRHGTTGVIVPPGDSAALAAALVGMLERPEAARSMGQEGRRLALAAYAREPMIEATLQAYARLLGGPDGPTGGR